MTDNGALDILRGDLVKGAARGGKYYKRIPKMMSTGKMGYRYFYTKASYEKHMGKHHDGATNSSRRAASKPTAGPVPKEASSMGVTQAQWDANPDLRTVTQDFIDADIGYKGFHEYLTKHGFTKQALYPDKPSARPAPAPDEVRGFITDAAGDHWQLTEEGSLRWTTRANSGGEEHASQSDISDARRVARAVREKFGKQVTAKMEIIDEWVDLQFAIAAAPEPKAPGKPEVDPRFTKPTGASPTDLMTELLPKKYPGEWTSRLNYRTDQGVRFSMTSMTSGPSGKQKKVTKIHAHAPGGEAPHLAHLEVNSEAQVHAFVAKMHAKQAAGTEASVANALQEAMNGTGHEDADRVFSALDGLEGLVNQQALTAAEAALSMKDWKGLRRAISRLQSGSADAAKGREYERSRYEREQRRKKTASLRDALDHPEGREIVDSIEDMLSSHDGANRYKTELASAAAELKSLTGYQYKFEKSGYKSHGGALMKGAYTGPGVRTGSPGNYEYSYDEPGARRAGKKGQKGQKGKEARTLKMIEHYAPETLRDLLSEARQPISVKDAARAELARRGKLTRAPGAVSKPSRLNVSEMKSVGTVDELRSAKVGAKIIDRGVDSPFGHTHIVYQKVKQNEWKPVRVIKTDARGKESAKKAGSWRPVAKVRGADGNPGYLWEGVKYNALSHYDPEHAQIKKSDERTYRIGGCVIVLP